MKSKLRVLIYVGIFAVMLTANAFGAAKYVNVKLPTFNVMLNGITVDNSNRDYPLLTYKGITYFPMTYHDSRFLGLETHWSENDGLKINKSESIHGYVDLNSTVNKSNNTATVPNFTVKVNENVIENSKEKYPLLLFRNVTYFPLTWRFAVDEFGWKYKFTKENGLEINNQSNYGLKVSEVNLPVAERNRDSNNEFTVAGDYFYYEGDKGNIYQAPVNNPSAGKAIYKLPMWTYGDSYVYPELDTVNNQAMLTYHQGGASMGTDYRIILHEDGTNENFSKGYLNRKDFGNYIVDVNQFSPPGQNNLSIKKYGQEEYRSIGSPEYIYGWVWHKTESGSGGSPSDDLYLIGDYIYVLAYYKPQEEIGTTGIYRININTGETLRICEESAEKFIIDDDVIYFTDKEGYLYKTVIDSNKVEKLSDFTVSDFTVLNHTVYYVSEESKGLELFKLGESTSVNPGGHVEKLVSCDGYVYCIFENSAPYKLIVFNKKGKQIFKTNSSIRFAKINNSRLFYQKK